MTLLSYQSSAAVFVYGSLVFEPSYVLSVGARPHAAYVSEVQGYERSWCIANRKDRFPCVGLGIIKELGARVNGCIYVSNAEDLSRLDERELKYGYEKTSISTRDFQCSDSPELEALKQVVAYSVNPAGCCQPGEFPLLQSYLDIVLSGFLSHGFEFACRFVELTAGWHENWINDRESPQYVRADMNCDAEAIDSVLATTIPKILLHRRRP